MAAGRIVLSQYMPARDRNGRLVPGALLNVYTNGTTTKASIYAEEALSTPLANPVAANSSGQFPAIWASDAITYTLSITAADGSSIGNPSVFDDYSVSTDADTASVALAEAAAASAAADLAEILAIQASGDDAAAINARAAKAQNGADFADVDAVLDNLTVTQSGTGAVARTGAAKLKDIVNARDYGVTADGTTNDTAALQAAIAANPGKAIMLPPGTIRLGNVGGLNFAGTRIVGDSRYETIVKPISGLAAGSAIFYNTDAATGTSAYMSVSNIRFRFDGENVTGVDLSSVNNSVVEQCYFAGSEAGATVTGVGVKFGSPRDEGSYSNNVRDCAFYSLDIGVQYLVNANSNMVTGGECIFCDIGVDAAPTGHLDTPRVIGMRFEGGGIGVKEKSVGGNYIACRFEDNSVADIDFIDNGAGDQSQRPLIVGGYTATTLTSLRNLSNAVSPIILAPDMGRYDVESTTAKKHYHGRHVFSAYSTALNPTVASGIEYSAYFYDSPIIRNQISLEFSNATADQSVIAVTVDSSNRTVIRSFDRKAGADNAVVLGGGASVIPMANNTTDIGTNALRYKDGYFFGDLFANDISIDGIIYIDGLAVLGPQGAALPADATDLATALTLVNAIKARMVAHGLVAA